MAGEERLLVAFQGMRGAYSEQACREKLGSYDSLPCKTFEEVFEAVEEGRADLGMLPVENSVAGVVNDSYDLLATHHMHVVGEHYLRVRHCLLGVAGSSMATVRRVYSHPQALAQCHAYLLEKGWERRAVFDTAGAAAEIAERNDPQAAAIASELCAALYDLQVLECGIQDSPHNTTRFLIVAREGQHFPPGPSCKTSLLFEVRDIPAALYKCLGGFATNGINLTRLESRPVKGKSWVYHFYLDFQGRPDEPRCQLALEELKFYTANYKILGCYPEAPCPDA